MISRKEALDHAKSIGITTDEIEVEGEKYVRQVGTVPFNNMIRALSMMSALNTREEWLRLCAAYHARSLHSLLSRPRNRK